MLYTLYAREAASCRPLHTHTPSVRRYVTFAVPRARKHLRATIYDCQQPSPRRWPFPPTNHPRAHPSTHFRVIYYARQSIARCVRRAFCGAPRGQTNKVGNCLININIWPFKRKNANILYLLTNWSIYEYIYIVLYTLQQPHFDQ